MNAAGIAVGLGSDPTLPGRERALRFDGGGRVVDLGEFTGGLPAGLTLAEAVAIDDAGRILVHARDAGGWRHLVLVPH